MKTGLFMAAAAVALCSCAGPLTSPQTGVRGCSIFLHPADGGAVSDDWLRRELGGAGKAGKPLNMLLLSGGGKYGAYGAGVLKGWSDLDEQLKDGGSAGHISRSSIDVVTGISTGALLASFAAVGNADDVEAVRTYVNRATADEAMRKAYDVNDPDVWKTRGPILSLGSNALSDIRGRLETRVTDMINLLWDALRAIPASRKVLVGVVNLTNGRFYIADLLEIARSNQANAKDCYREIVLASAAVPVEFPPRFIDGHGYVDGGVRFGLFLGDTYRGSEGALRAFIPENESTPIRTVNFRAIVNGTLSPNGPADDPALAERCDASGVIPSPTECAPAKNKLIAIAKRSAADILVDQIYRDSAYRLYADLKLNQVLGRYGYRYVSTKDIATEHRERGPCVRANRKYNFDRQYMGCLYRIGVKHGASENWLSFPDIPRGPALAAGGKR